jgi:SLA1 homology domain 1, SHD1
MLTLAIGYEVGLLGLVIIAPLALVSALAMGLGQTWIVDNAYRERKNATLIWWTPFYLQFYILKRLAICWRPLGVIALGGAFYVALLFFLLGDQLTGSKNANPTLANKAQPQQAKPFDLSVRSSPARRSAQRENSVAESRQNAIQTQPKPAAPVNETVWSYESLAPSNNRPPRDTDSRSETKQFEAPSQPVLSPVFEEDDGYREWSNLTGSYKVVAKVDVVEGDFIHLKRRDGRKIRVEIAKLSAEDRRFLEPILLGNPFEVVGGR